MAEPGRPSQSETHNLLVAMTGEDRIGLIAAVTGSLYDLGGNLADASFAVLGAGFEFTAVVEFPADVTAEEVAAELGRIDGLAGATISVREFVLPPVQEETARITHHIEIRGGDRPGLVARLSDVFIEFGANIVRMNCARMPAAGGLEYVTSFDVSIPELRAAACLAAVTNTAGSLRLACEWHEAAGD